MSSTTYPPALRSIFKAVPCLVMCVAASTVFWIYNYAVVRHPHDHAPRPSYKYPAFKQDQLGSSTTSVCEMISTASHIRNSCTLIRMSSSFTLLDHLTIKNHILYYCSCKNRNPL